MDAELLHQLGFGILGVLVFGALYHYYNLAEKHGKTVNDNGKKTPLGWVLLIVNIIFPLGLVIYGFFFSPVAPRNSPKCREPNLKNDSLITIIILPFHNDGSETRNYSRILANRLTSLSEEDSIHVVVDFKQDFILPAVIDRRFQDSLLECEQADLLVWGSYSVIEQKDHLSLNYYSKKYSGISSRSSQLVPTNMSSFSSGDVQGDVEGVAYFLSALTYFNKFIRVVDDTPASLTRHKGILPFDNSGSNLNASAARLLKAATDLIEKYHKRHPIDYITNSSYFASVCYLYLDSFSKAATFMEKELLKKVSAGGMVSLSTYYLLAGDTQKSDSVLSIVALRYPNNADVLFQKSGKYREKGMFDSAIAALKKSIELDPNLTSSYYYLGASYHEKAEKDKVLAYFDSAHVYYTKLIAMDSLNDEAFYARGRVQENIYNYIADLSKAIELNPKEKYFLERGAQYGTLMMPDNAILDFKKAIAINSSNGMAYFYLGEAYFAKRAFNEAMSSYETALTYELDFLIMRIHLGECYATVNNFPAAKLQVTIIEDMLLHGPDKTVPQILQGSYSNLKKWVESSRGIGPVKSPN